MADYDSDSSEGEFTETNVLLGYASKDAEEDTISKLGGRPDWLEAGKPPSAALARCKVCKDIMVLLLQLNGELPERFPTHERRLYVFACRRETCRRKAGTIRAVRGVRIWKDEGDTKPRKDEREERKQESAKPEKQREAQPRLGEALFGANPFGGSGAGGGGGGISNGSNPFASQANPFSTASSIGAPSSSASNPFAGLPATTPTIAAPAAAAAETPAAALSKTFAETLAIGTTPAGPPPPPEPWPETSAQQQAPYPTLYLADADYETLDDDDDNDAAKLPANVRMADADAPEPSALDREAFESSMDATFQKFADRLAQNPEQVIRYEFAGAPLLYSKTDAVGEALARRGMPRCGGCGGPRTFEVQLTPNAIAELEADDGDVGLDGMEWGTVIVGVCEADCVPRWVGEGEAAYLEEWAGVQWEELVKNK